MGFSGYYVVGRSGQPLTEQGALAGVRGNLTLYQQRADGWQIWQHPSEPDIGDMGALARSMGSPVLFGFVMDSDCVVVEAAAPESGSWYACLAREAMAGYLGASGMVLDDLFLTAEDAVRRAAEWAEEAGTTMAAEALKGVLCAKRPEPFAEELFFRFLDGLGIPGLSE
ncbi:hypothetical protein AB0D12_09310 [Streptomyces sp. NPDC048479]|uniref:hypothetical protein n=1 Tax=Streptomyces sp. NPDC048479 TaxID=3154725 RepID=UPI00342C139D